MPKAIRIQQQGGPEVLKWEDVQVGEPGPGEARVRHKACGLNFLDVYQRSGLYKIPLPSGMGSEGAGVVEAGPYININVLRMTIQGLEMQKAGLAAMQNAAGGASPGNSEPSGREDPSKK